MVYGYAAKRDGVTKPTGHPSAFRHMPSTSFGGYFCDLYKVIQPKTSVKAAVSRLYPQQYKAQDGSEKASVSPVLLLDRVNLNL